VLVLVRKVTGEVPREVGVGRERETRLGHGRDCIAARRMEWKGPGHCWDVRVLRWRGSDCWRRRRHNRVGARLELAQVLTLVRNRTTQKRAFSVADE